MCNLKNWILLCMISEVERIENVKIDKEYNKKFYQILDTWADIIADSTKEKIDKDVEDFICLYLKDTD